MSYIHVKDERIDPSIQPLAEGDILLMGNGGKSMIIKLKEGYGVLDLGQCNVHYTAPSIAQLIGIFKDARSAPRRAVSSAQVQIVITGEKGSEIKIEYGDERDANENRKI